MATQKRKPAASDRRERIERALEIIQRRIDLIEEEFSDVPSCMEYRDALLLAARALRDKLN